MKMKKEEVRKILIENKICVEKNVEVMINILNTRAKKIDKCGKAGCNHEHMIPSLLELVLNKEKQFPKIDRLEKEKRDILSKRKVKKGG